MKQLLAERAPSYKLVNSECRMGMNSRRVIENPLGQRMALDILPGSDGMRLSRLDSMSDDMVVLDVRGARILAAYLASALIVNRSARPPEELDDASMTVLSLHEYPAPLLRITQGRRSLDIHAPSWEPLRCEIEIVIPRMDGSGGFMKGSWH